jgi:anaerobic ribonucleoside-triphosphate reductase activating protein
VYTLGPGKRAVIWLQGCGRRCEGCANPELQAFDPVKDIPAAEIFTLMEKMTGGGADGFTLTGGEPFAQAGELAALTRLLSRLSGDILIYTGYTLEALREMRDPDVDAALGFAAALIDGAYVAALNTGTPLRGSSNQRLHILKERYAPLYARELLRETNCIQNIPTGDGMLSVGIHMHGFRETLADGAERFGLERT